MSKYHFCVSCLSMAAAAILFATGASAQTICGERTMLIATLAKKFAEQPAAFGIAGQKSLVELFTSETGSWTMLLTNPKGGTCIIATGQSWEEYPPATAKMTGL